MGMSVVFISSSPAKILIVSNQSKNRKPGIHNCRTLKIAIMFVIEAEKTAIFNGQCRSISSPWVLGKCLMV
jgi:hypothetical protein